MAGFPLNLEAFFFIVAGFPLGIPIFPYGRVSVKLKDFVFIVAVAGLSLNQGTSYFALWQSSR